MSAPILSRNDIEKIAGKILVIYNEAYIPEKHLFYQVVPEDLAEGWKLTIKSYPWTEPFWVLPHRTNNMCRCTTTNKSAAIT